MLLLGNMKSLISKKNPFLYILYYPGGVISNSKKRSSYHSYEFILLHFLFHMLKLLFSKVLPVLIFFLPLIIKVSGIRPKCCVGY